MKRRYKTGDWFRVPLFGEHDAIGIITHACRSRLFGYFFAVVGAHEPAFEDLKRLRAQDAVTCALFGGAGLEEARWPLIATSLPFDPAAWPFPQFSSRGVFGRTWQRVTYDPLTMSVVQREAISGSPARNLPGGRFAAPEELEALLQSRIDGEAPETPLVVCEVRTPVDIAQIEPLLSLGGRVQFSEPLDELDLQRLAAFIAAHPDVELRVHGFTAFDLNKLRAIEKMRSLVLDVRMPLHVEALASLQALESLRIGHLDERASLDVLQQLPCLHRLEIRGANADMPSVAQLRYLDALTIVDTPPVDFGVVASAKRLRSLTIAHVKSGISGVGEMAMLERLALRDLQLTALPDLSRCTRLHAIELRNVTMLHDLTPLASAPALRELRVEGMPQMHVSDFRPLVTCPALQSINIEIGSKTKSREVYRLLRRGHTL